MSELETRSLLPISSEISSASHDHDHDHDHGPVDGGGDPCPTPLMWQEVRENFLKESALCEVIRGPHRLIGRTLGDGPPLYFLNNFAATAELYSLVIWLLRDHFRCVVFDTVTDDRKAALRTMPDMTEFSEDLFSLADHLGDQEFHLFGAGFGAAVALQATLLQPDRIQRVVLQHGFANRRLTFFERSLASICLRSGRTLDDLPQRRRFQAVNHKPWFPPFDPSRFDFLVQSTGTLLLRDLGRRALAAKSFEIESQLDKVSRPVLLLRTEGEGRMAAESQNRLETKLKDVRVEWMHSAGQHPCLTHPHRVAKIVKPFYLPETPGP